MKCIKLFCLTFFACTFLQSCGSNAAGKEKSGTVAAVDATSANPTSSSSGSDAVFSYTLDGVKIAGGEVDDLQISNVAVIAQSNNNNKVQFFLNDVYKESTESFAHSLRFTVPDKTGSITIAESDNNWNVELFIATSQEGKYIVYGNESFTINITSISATRISGTFSGKEKIGERQPAGKNEISITDGKFDIPIRKV